MAVALMRRKNRAFHPHCTASYAKRNRRDVRISRKCAADPLFPTYSFPSLIEKTFPDLRTIYRTHLGRSGKVSDLQVRIRMRFYRTSMLGHWAGK